MREIIVPGIIPSEKLTSRRTPTVDFLKRVFKGQTLKVENLGCPTEFVDVSSRGFALGPQSLFFQTVHSAYSNHYRLALRPEVMAYLIAHEVATAVKMFPDRYRSIFTTDPGKPEINVDDPSLIKGNPASDWSRTIAMFENKLNALVPSNVGACLSPNFTTSTPATKAASMVAFMDAASPFYTFKVTTLCGIPAIRLDGELADWLKLNMLVCNLIEIFKGDPLLMAYLNRLLPVTAKLATQASKDSSPDSTFWRDIYKIHGGSGGDKATGWLMAFLAFVWDTKGKAHARDNGECPVKTWQEQYGVTTDVFPTHVSSVPFLWNYYNTIIPMHFAGGILSVTDEGGFLTPRLSYAVLED